MRQRFTTLIIVSLIPGNPSKFGYKTAKPRGTKVELISFAIISTVFAEAHQIRKAMQADDGEEASQPSLLTAALASVSQSCVSCANLIPRDWPRRFQYGPAQYSRWNLVCGDDLKVCLTQCVCCRVRVRKGALVMTSCFYAR